MEQSFPGVYCIGSFPSIGMVANIARGPRGAATAFPAKRSRRVGARQHSSTDAPGRERSRRQQRVATQLKHAYAAAEH
eukprot:6205029-Pleurochrysis_carterae.AAC.2